MSDISFIFYVNKTDIEMTEISSRNILIWSGSDDGKTWDNVLAKLDHLTDREPTDCLLLRNDLDNQINYIPNRHTLSINNILL